MKEAVINNELTLSYPDSYSEMSSSELAGFFSSADGRWGIRDSQRHIVISLSRTKAGFLCLLTDAKSVVSGAEKNLARSLSGYKRTERFRTKAAFENAYGIRFEYMSDGSGTAQSGELSVFRFKNKFYALYYLARKEDFLLYHRDIEDIISSIGTL